MDTPRFDPDFPHQYREMAEDVLKAFERAVRAMPNHAILDENGEVLPISVYDEAGELIESQLIQWAQWFERNSAQRRMAATEIDNHVVSTVFLGLNQQYKPKGRALWFETLVFGLPKSQTLPITGEEIQLRPQLWGTRTSTRAEAFAAHDEGVAWLKAYLVTL